MMAVGTGSYMGLAVPLFGECEKKQGAIADDIWTLTGASSQSGDFIVCRNSSESEVFVVDVSGNVTVAGTLAVTGAATFTGVATLTANPIFNAAILTTAPTTGLTTGEVFFYDAANIRHLAIASGAGTLWRLTMTQN